VIALKFSEIDIKKAKEQLKEEWNSFQVPELIHSRIRELFWEHYERDETVKALMEEFDMKECYAARCYYFSEANQAIKERLERVGMFYNCISCNDACIPKCLK
jgi:hypothetical protein